MPARRAVRPSGGVRHVSASAKLLTSSELPEANGLSPCSVTLSSETKGSTRRRE
jgi:hypothetical protein